MDIRDQVTENPKGTSGLVLAFLIALVSLGALIWNWDGDVTAGITLVLSAGVAMIANVVRNYNAS